MSEPVVVSREHPPPAPALPSSAVSTDGESSMVSTEVEADLLAIMRMQHALVEQHRRELHLRQHEHIHRHASQRHESPLFSTSALALYRGAGEQPGAALPWTSSTKLQQTAFQPVAPSLPHAAHGLEAAATTTATTAARELSRWGSSVAAAAPHAPVHGGDSIFAECRSEGDGDSSDIDRHEEHQIQRAQRALQAEIVNRMENLGRPSSPLLLRPQHAHGGSDADVVTATSHPLPSGNVPRGNTGGDVGLPRGAADVDVGDGRCARPDLVTPSPPFGADAMTAAAAHSWGGFGSSTEAESAAQDSYRAFLAEVRRQHREVLRRQQVEHARQTGTILNETGRHAPPQETLGGEDHAGASVAAVSAGVPKAVPQPQSSSTHEAAPAWINRYRSPPLAALYHAQAYGRTGQAPSPAVPHGRTAGKPSQAQLAYEQHLHQLGLTTPSSVGAAASSDQGNSPYIPHEYRHSAQKPPRETVVGALVAPESEPLPSPTRVPGGGAAAATVAWMRGAQPAATVAAAAPPPPPLLAPFTSADVVDDSSWTEAECDARRRGGAPVAAPLSTAATASCSPVEPFADVLLHDSLQASQGTSPQRTRLSRPSVNVSGRSPLHVAAPICMTGVNDSVGGAVPVGAAVYAPPSKLTPSSLVPELGTLTPRSVPSASVIAGSGPRSFHGQPTSSSLPHHAREPPAVAFHATTTTTTTVGNLHDSGHDAVMSALPTTLTHAQAVMLLQRLDPKVHAAHPPPPPPPPHQQPQRAEDAGRAGDVTLLPTVEAAAPTAAPLPDQPAVDAVWQPSRSAAPADDRGGPSRLHTHGRGPVALDHGASTAALRKAIDNFWKPKRKRAAASRGSSTQECTPLSGSSPDGAAVSFSGAGDASPGQRRVPFYQSSRIGAVLHDVQHDDREHRRQCAVPTTAPDAVPTALSATASGGEAAQAGVAGSKKVFYYYGKGFRAL